MSSRVKQGEGEHHRKVTSLRDHSGKGGASCQQEIAQDQGGWDQ